MKGCWTFFHLAPEKINITIKKLRFGNCLLNGNTKNSCLGKGCSTFSFSKFKLLKRLQVPQHPTGDWLNLRKHNSSFFLWKKNDWGHLLFLYSITIWDTNLLKAISSTSWTGRRLNWILQVFLLFRPTKNFPGPWRKDSVTVKVKAGLKTSTK